MSSRPQPTQPTATRHPGWCSPQCCTVTATDVDHASVPVVFRTCGARFELTLVRNDEVDFPREWDDPPELSLRVESTTVTDPGAGVYLRLDELPGVIEALTAQLYRARLSTPVTV